MALCGVMGTLVYHYLLLFCQKMELAIAYFIYLWNYLVFFMIYATMPQTQTNLLLLMPRNKRVNLLTFNKNILTNLN